MIKLTNQDKSRLSSSLLKVASPTILSWRRLLRTAVMLLTLAWSNNIQADTSVATWSALKTEMENGGTINVTADCTDPSPSTTSYLEVPTGKTVILNLNGHTLNRGLGNNTEGIDNGLVIKNSGTLTINGSGTITGGNNNGHGGGIYSVGTLNLNNVNVTNNKAKNYGGGISHRLNGALNITGGSITGNIASFMHGGGIYASVSLSITGVVIQNNTCGESGGGIYCYTGKTLTISGSNTISDNKRVSGTSISVNNVYLQSSAIINVAGNISNSIIGVQTSGVFTSGLSGKGTASNFFSDDPTCAITLNGSGEAQKESINNWATLKAAMAAGGNIKLAGNCTEETHELSSYLSVPSGKTVNLDLNGCNIDRGITSSNPWTNCPCVIYNAGTLTITDTSTGSPGTITGGYGDSDDAFSGGIANTGTLTINGGTITGITGGSGTSNYGSGINNRNSGIVVINGGTISGNSLDGITNKGTLTINGGTISNNTSSGISNTGTLKVYGGTITANNTYGVNTTTSIHIKGTVTINNRNSGYDLYLKNTSVMIVDDALTSSTNIGVTAPNSPRVITSGLNGKGNASNFYWYNGGSSAAIRLNDAGEAVIKVSPNLSVSMTGWTYGEAANDPSIGASDNQGNGTVTYTYKAAGESVYSSTKPTNAGTHTVKASVPETALYLEKEATNNYTVAQREATISWTNTALTYNGTAQTPTASVSNIVTGDACTVTVSGEQTNASSSAYTATATALGNANYKLPTADADKQTSFTIGKAALTVTASNKTITYGDEEANAGVTYTGFVNGETSAVLGSTLTYTYPKYVNSTLAGSYSVGSPVSDENTNYKIAPNGLTSNNYSITFVDGTLTVAQKEATLSWTNTELTYNGTAQKPTASVSNIVTGDACTVTVSGEQTDASTSAYTATATELSNANYKLPTTPTQTFTIGKAALTITADAKNKTYGETDPEFTYTSSGLVGADAITGALSRAAGEDVNSYAIIQGTLTAGGNYSITYTGANLTITQKEVGITWGQTLLTYNNTTQAPEATASGLVGTDVCDVIVSGAAKEVGSYTATATGLSNANYKLPTTGLSTPFQIVDQLVISFAADQQWSTWYGLNNYQVPAGMTAYKVTAIGEDKVTVDAINYIPANTGVLLYRTETDAAMVTGNAYTGATSSITSLLKNGSPTPYKDYILHSNQFVLSTVSTIGANRCYLPGSSAAGARGGLLIDTTGGGTTDLFFDTMDASENDSWFDLQGRGIEKPQKKGLYIRNGKKVVVK